MSLEAEVKVVYVGLTILNKATITERESDPYRYEFEKFFSNKKDRLLWVSDVIPTAYEGLDWIKKCQILPRPALTSRQLTLSIFLFWPIKFISRAV